MDFFEDWYGECSVANPLKGDFRDVVKKVPDGLQFLYLDADHSLEATLEAFRLYAPKVKRGGYIAIHDALELHPGELDWPGVNQALHVLIREGHRLVAAAHRIAVFQK